MLIEERCLKFWITIPDNELKGPKYESGVISGLAALGFGHRKRGLGNSNKLRRIEVVMDGESHECCVGLEPQAF